MFKMDRFNTEEYKHDKPRIPMDKNNGKLLKNSHFLTENVPPYIDNFVIGAKRSRKLIKLPNGKELHILLLEDEKEVLVEYEVCESGVIHISDKKDFKLEGSKEDLPVFVYAEGKILEIVLDENRKVTIYEHNIPNSPKGLDGLDLKEFVENHSNEDTALEVPDL